MARSFDISCVKSAGATRFSFVAALLGTLALGQPAVAGDRFEEPVAVRGVDGRVLEFPDRLAAPALGDFDADGRRDLLVGQHSGRMRVLRNLGTDDRPKFSDAAWFDEILPDGRIPVG